MLGIPLSAADLQPGSQEAVWAPNAPAVRAFLSVTTQWRYVARSEGRLVATGLDYAAVKPGFKLAGIEMTPALWGDVRIVENGARAALNED